MASREQDLDSGLGDEWQGIFLVIKYSTFMEKGYNSMC